ncbi:MAG: glycosyltransferase [Patescibacteria group bacterium]
MKPVVSIIIPTYNRAAYLPRAISSVVEQSYSAWELIIIDDGSTDATQEVVRSIAATERRIRSVRRLHRGVYPALNTGIRTAVGTYITFLGSDDRLNSSHISRRVGYLMRHPEVDMLHGGVRIIGQPYVVDADHPGRRIHLKYCAIGGTFFGRREVFTSLGGFQTRRYGGDAAFLAVAQGRFTIRHVSWPTYVYHRDTPGSITNKKLARNKV